MQTGNMLIFSCTFNRHSTYGKLSWSRDVNRTTSLNQRHMRIFVTGQCSLTMTDASFRAAYVNKWWKNTTKNLLIEKAQLHNASSLLKSMLCLGKAYLSFHWISCPLGGHHGDIVSAAPQLLLEWLCFSAQQPSPRHTHCCELHALKLQAQNLYAKEELPTPLKDPS